VKDCRKWHQISVIVDHDRHAQVKAAIRKSPYSSVNMFINHMLDVYLGPHDNSPPLVDAPERVVKVMLADLENGTEADVLAFGHKHGLPTGSKRKVIDAAHRATHIIVKGEFMNRGYLCKFCDLPGHNIRTCPERLRLQ